jgi:orotidine-5'-phosphate decarboxylase
VRAGIDAHAEGLLVSASRSVLYASSDSEFVAAARGEALRLRDAINASRETAR